MENAPITFAGFIYPRHIGFMRKAPIAERLEMRRREGQHYRLCPYYQDGPKMATDKGRSFYLESDFQPGLRWTWCDEVEGAHIDHTGWYADQDGCSKIRGIVFRLPHGRGFLAGQAMGEHMTGSLDYYIWDNEKDAARAANEEAKRVAEREIEYQASSEAA